MATQPKNVVCTVGLRVPHADAVQRIETAAAPRVWGGEGERNSAVLLEVLRSTVPEIHVR
jgi:hypothetical protein